jgi:Fe-S cluster assembly protein SufD
VDDSAHSSFLGKITVDKEAEGVDAELFNKNLLLSNKATAITEPQLDINTKEINCKHGCTVSNINKEDLYYLESRGIETVWAEETLKKCFLTI